MRHFKGMYFCHTPIADPEGSYDCSHIISIDRIPEDCPVEKMFKMAMTGTKEWNNCCKEVRMKNEKRFDYVSATLKDEVVEWLNENVRDSISKLRQDMPQGWMIYDPYLVEQAGHVDVFFFRQSDAMAFKLRWS